MEVKSCQLCDVVCPVLFLPVSSSLVSLAAEDDFSMPVDLVTWLRHHSLHLLTADKRSRASDVCIDIGSPCHTHNICFVADSICKYIVIVLSCYRVIVLSCYRVIVLTMGINFEVLLFAKYITSVRDNMGNTIYDLWNTIMSTLLSNQLFIPRSLAKTDPGLKMY